ncbi:MAG: hypothetical protein NTY96_04755 [Bacteroidetes bacterium]|nr:hypothetical protein [Bacteroidota bacterium]
MFFLRVTVLFILLAKPLYYSAQQPSLLDADELVLLGDKNGLKAVERLINPMALLYLDTTYASHIVDWEFRQGFLHGHPDSIGYYVLELPRYTLDIASNTDNRHAASNLLRYYCSVPKVIKSDTVYWIYDQLYRFLPVFICRKPYQTFLERKLRKDFEEWSRISTRTAPVKYPDPSVEFDRLMNMKPLNNRPDSRYIALMLGLTLQQLKSPGFDEVKIKNLRRMQTCLNNKRFQLPVLSGEYRIYTEPIETQIIPTIIEYRNISQLVSDKAAMALIISSWLTRHNFNQNMPYSQSKFLVKRPNKVYFEVYYEFGMQAIRLTLLGNKSIMIEKTMEAID